MGYGQKINFSGWGFTAVPYRLCHRLYGCVNPCFCCPDGGCPFSP